MLLQSLTVLPSHCHCGSTFLRVTWRVDLTGDLAELEDLTKSGGHLDNQHVSPRMQGLGDLNKIFLEIPYQLLNAANSFNFKELAVQRGQSWIWRRIQAWTGEQRGNLFDWLERLLQKQSKMLPLHMTVIHKASMFWLLIALLELLLHTASSVRLTQAVVSFECEPQRCQWGFEAEKQGTVVWASDSQIVTLLLLSASLYLGNRAQWRICLEVPAALLADVLNVTAHGKELLDLRCLDGSPLPLTRFKQWPDGLVYAQFGLYAEKPTMLVRRRKYLLVLGRGLTMILLFGASSSCWGCINEISLPNTGGLFDVEAQLLLLGSCGRHNGSGIPCLLGLYAGESVRSHVWLCPKGEGWQVANFLDSEPWDYEDRSQWRRSQSVVSGVRIVQEPDDDLWNLVHSRGLPTEEGPSTVYVQFDAEPGDEDPRGGRRAVRQMVPVAKLQRGPKQETTAVLSVPVPTPGADVTVPTPVHTGCQVDFLPGAFFCSVPRRGRTRDARFQRTGTRSRTSEGGGWTARAACWDGDWQSGSIFLQILVLEEYGRISQHENELSCCPGDTKSCHFQKVSVGRRAAWSNLSMLCAGAALALIGFDLSFHLSYSLQGTLLKDCEDILSGRCLELEPRPGGRQVASGLGVSWAPVLCGSFVTSQSQQMSFWCGWTSGIGWKDLYLLHWGSMCSFGPLVGSPTCLEKCGGKGSSS
ncbi:unnamed protein product [Durusdinium trenchii]|uniref:Uncharacterized protein n=1 Tax=Durusdinium trenchii TaxID=1381693 RepID=A0ABP0LGM4_9DINO